MSSHPGDSAPTDALAPARDPSTARSARLSIRLPEPQKALIERAAAADGLTTTAFAVSTLVERARAVVLGQHLAELSEADRAALLASLRP